MAIGTLCAKATLRKERARERARVYQRSVERLSTDRGIAADYAYRTQPRLTREQCNNANGRKRTMHALEAQMQLERK